LANENLVFVLDEGTGLDGVSFNAVGVVNELGREDFGVLKAFESCRNSSSSSLERKDSANDRGNRWQFPTVNLFFL
jgi:hypothetical protein